jgi:RNA polymerase sigma-70 factor (ECF subfamily)
MDSGLVVRAQAGDEPAFERLALEIGGRMHAVAYSIVRDRQLAEDATQQALLAMWRGLSKLRDPDHFEAWAFRVLVRACRSEVRSVRRWVPNLVSRPPETRTESDIQSAIADRDQLERGFRGLSFDHRAVVVLHYYLDMSASEIADVLDIPPGTARSRLYSATLSLRAALDADARAATSDKTKQEMVR